MIIFIILLGTLFRFINLNQSFWLDEAISALSAQKPFPYQWSGIIRDVHPPLYYIILHFWMLLGNLTEWFLRIPSVFFGILTILVIYKIAYKLFNKNTALVSALFMATSQFHVYYSQELRMYSLFCLLATCSFWAFYKKMWFFLTVINILGIYTQYMFGLLFIPQVIWLIYKYGDYKKDLINWFTSTGLIIIAFIPWLPNFMEQLASNRQLLITLPAWKSLAALPLWKLLPQIFLKFSLGRIDFLNKYFYLFIFFTLSLIYLFIISNLKNKINDRLKYILIWLLSPIFGSLIISFFIPIADTWRFIFLLPEFILLISYAVTNSAYSKVFIIIILIINLLSNLLYWNVPRYQRENWRDAVAFMDKKYYPVIFVVENGFAPYEWYKKNNKLVCGPTTLDNCLKYNQFFYVSYLQELFDPGKKVESDIKTAGFKASSVNDFTGVGFITNYANSY